MLRGVTLSLVVTSALAQDVDRNLRGSLPFDPATHAAGKSSGCGKSSPYTPGKTVTAKGTYAGVSLTYRVYVPKSYNQNTPLPVILQHPGWGMSASSEESGAGITGYADSLGFISVTPQGANDNTHSGGPWYSWNAAGTSQSPGAAGATCTSKASAPSYCYTSCKGCNDSPQCDWTTCDETVTPTGTGTKDVGGFIPGLYNTLESQLCIDTTREFAAGESNGGIQTYQLGVDLSSRLAAIAPQFGSFHRGFAMAPSTHVPVIDLHGTRDTTVPGNVSLSGDGYYYTTTAEIFGGGKYSKGWKRANSCTSKLTHWPTKYDGQKKFNCMSECTDGSVVRCSWNGGHDWLFGGGAANGWLVTDFLLRWTKPSHAGFGRSAGDSLQTPNVLEDVVVLAEDDTPPMSWDNLPLVMEGAHGGHYGDPDQGCLSDEEVVFAGTGRVCAPKIGTSVAGVAGEPPAPTCKLGDGNAGKSNGCPVDANVDGLHSRSRPVCVGKGNTTDPYTEGQFHCLLACPCYGHGKECGRAADWHCPHHSRCERGELRNRAHGVCTYHGTTVTPEELVV